MGGIRCLKGGLGIVASPELGKLHPASVRELLITRKRRVIIWKAQGLEAEPSLIERGRMAKLFMPEKETRYQMIEGEWPEEAEANLALKPIELPIASTAFTL